MSDVQQAVRAKYAAIASAVTDASANPGCCGPVACGCGDPMSSNLYSDAETGGLPADAVAASLGCGNPTALLPLESGQTVLDLGSGRRDRRAALGEARRPDRQGLRPRHDRRDAGAGAREPAQSRRDKRRVPKGHDRSDSAARQLGGRDHLELRDQPVGRQGRRAARGVSGAEAGRALRGLRRGRARRSAGRRPPQHGAVGRLHRRRARGIGVRRRN